ncbi:unnamed protein product [Chondrus crispus]|uniref:FAD dependent oxidoreductase domain-containing protein n=1 Tax=Chondrus crispus TaxID=2769 RepID=R7Q0A9_CHOCR|nr:unnamed protein product [Chondrus crispus]CDF32082.1 unnamed protein product [Chondrus crispus]|eukprot:XP_005711747.1 unnamed protein product [Chondrus crispus]
MSHLPADLNFSTMVAFLSPSALPSSSISSTFLRPLPLPHPRLPPLRARHAPRPATLCTHRDVVIIGAGLAGLSIAHELSLRGASVTILSSPRPPAGLAAAGMLAPLSETLPAPLDALAANSRSLYPAFTTALHHLTGIDPCYVSSSDFLLPRLHGEHLADPSSLHWLRRDHLAAVEPLLGPNVVAAKRVPSEAHVDNRRLMAALRAACDKLGVVIRDRAPARRLVVSSDASRVDGVLTSEGDVVKGGHFVLAAGAWSRELLPPLPVKPVKGQMLALRAPDAHAEVLRHVLHGKKAYIVPKDDGRTFFVGATVEDGQYDLKNTAGGMAKLLGAAVEYVPAMAEYEFKEVWSGLRPATPDLMPVLGMSEFGNMSIATGYYRNGILLAPVTAKIAASVALGEMNKLPAELLDLVPHFSLGRFLGIDSHATVQAPSPVSPAPAEVKIHAKSAVPPSTAGPTIAEQKTQSNPADILVWRVLPDGTQEPVMPANLEQFHEEITPPGERSNSTPTNPAEVLVWRILPDGTKEPVMPANLEQSQEELAAQGEHSNSTPTTLGAANVPQASQSTVSRTQAQPRQETSPTEHMTASNDAYDDILQYKDDAKRIMNEALAANRAFGREKSSLEKDGGPVLSLSESEMRAFDKALERGLQDYREVESCFDENHPSAIATRAEAMWDSKAQGNNRDGNSGSSSTRLHVQGSNTSGKAGKSDGYY